MSRTSPRRYDLVKVCNHRFLASDSHVFQLEGHLTTTSTDRGLVAGQLKHLLLSKTVSLYSHTSANNVPWGEKILFSLPIPHEVSQDGAITALPPSFAAYRPGVSSEVNYVVKFDMVRKGFRRHEW